MTSKLPLLICLSATLFMTGVIWFVQVVHYPLFDRVQDHAFRRYHESHTRLTGFVVIIPMIVELLSSVYLVARRPEPVESWMVWLGLIAAVVSWGSSLCLSAPAHGRLASGFDPDVHRTLVSTNVVRLVSWTVHSAVLLLMTARSIR